MKLRAVLVSFLLLVSVSSSASEKKVYKFGIVPQFEARKLREIWNPILEELEKRTGVKFIIEGSPRIPDFESSFIRGDFDFAYMNPYHSLIAFDTQKYVPLVRDHARKLYGIVAVSKKSGIKSIDELVNKRIAFPAPNALGASLMVRSDLKSKKIKFDPIYLQTHTSAYLNVLLGKASAAGGVFGTYSRQKKNIRENLKIIYETKKVSPHPIVAHPRVPKEIVTKVKKAFLELGKDLKMAELLKKIPIKKVGIAKVEDYQELREMELEKSYVAPN
jgi:phosphonate transport system substrate-binding protein